VKKLGWNVGYKCSVCGAEGTLLEGVKSFKIDKRKNAPCGHKLGKCKIESVWV